MRETAYFAYLLPLICIALCAHNTLVDACCSGYTGCPKYSDCNTREHRGTLSWVCIDSSGQNVGGGSCSSPNLDLCADVQCGSHGSCDENSGSCKCIDGYTGAKCSTPPGLCSGVNCGPHGVCSPRNGVCLCTGGYTGGNCNIKPTSSKPRVASGPHAMMRADTEGASNQCKSSPFLLPLPHVCSCMQWLLERLWVS